MLSAHPCKGPDETFEAGRLLASVLAPGDVIGLVGNLGAGKTLLTQGMAAGLGVVEPVRVTSPTFSLINEYAGGRLPLVHVDLYRIESEAELEHLGLDEMLDNAGVSSVEWCEQFPVLPHDHLLVTIDITGDGARTITARGTGTRSTAIALAWATALAASPP